MPLKKLAAPSQTAKPIAPKWSPTLAAELNQNGLYVVMTRGADGSFVLGDRLSRDQAFDTKYISLGTEEDPFVLHPQARIAALYSVLSDFMDANPDDTADYDADLIQPGLEEEDVSEPAQAPAKVEPVAPAENNPSRPKKTPTVVDDGEDSADDSETTELFNQLSSFLKSYAENPSAFDDERSGKNKKAKSKKSGKSDGSAPKKRGAIGVKKSPKEILATLADGKVVDISNMSAEGAGMRCIATPGERSHKVFLPSIASMTNFRVVTDKADPVATFLKLLDVPDATINDTVASVSSALTERSAAVSAKGNTAKVSSPKADSEPVKVSSPKPVKMASPLSPRGGAQLSASALSGLIKKKK